MNVRCVLTDEEKLAAGRALAEATNDLIEIENDKARVVADFKAKLTAVEGHVSTLSNQLRSGCAFRDVECSVRFNDPRTGEKTIYRDDTGAKVETRGMTDEENQIELPDILAATAPAGTAPAGSGEPDLETADPPSAPAPAD